PGWAPAPCPAFPPTAPLGAIAVPALPVDVVPDRLEQARAAFSAGSYERVVQLTADLGTEPAASVLSVRALANFDTAEAERACAGAVARHPLSPELHYLW